MKVGADTPEIYDDVMDRVAETLPTERLPLIIRIPGYLLVAVGLLIMGVGFVLTRAGHALTR